jgi:DNA recombination protein RmuC
MNILFLIIGLIVGGIIGFLSARSRVVKFKSENSHLNENLANLKTEHENDKEKTTQLNTTILELTGEIGKATAETKVLKEQNILFQAESSQKIKEQEELIKQKSKLETENKNLEEKLDNQKTEIEEMQTKLTDSFKNLANEILDEKTKKFTENNKSNLDEILSPLKEKISNFEQKVENTYEKNLKDNTALIEQIKNLEKLNKQISDDASNLTKALKSDVKAMGNWGEVILERILEESGLQKGIEYIPQGEGMKLTDDEGHRFQPDVVIMLPDNKHIIVDSKVSLVHYEHFVAATEADQQQSALKDLNASVKAHIDGLHKKLYHDLKGINSPDFVLLFMPIEGSFALVVQNDASLYKYALDKHIVVVSPSTMLATLRTIAFIWRQENQTKNAIEIARQSGNLYDAFVRLSEDLEKIGTNIDRSSKSYNDAMKKLKTGKGNIVTRVENLKKLGAKASKQVSKKLLEESLPELGE